MSKLQNTISTIEEQARMKEYAEVLTGEDFSGRLSGTSGAYRAAQFLELEDVWLSTASVNRELFDADRGVRFSLVWPGKIANRRESIGA
ncbi:hypothetical protein [Alkalihalobacillus sp. TS-13]|uniref:hypothetical protein n=1 Tax=Alkalihalobacillus sp. TS-13 TaxID=2842455 RepID=UPI001C8815CE|nr:hypothetical protein [Alkalihalobacillus sp. TS-13]